MIVACADTGGVECGSGTELHGSQCVAPIPESGLHCGNGTHDDGTGTCVPDATSSSTTITCGAGTHLNGSICQADTPTTTLQCGAGTHVDGSSCLPDAPSPTCGDGTTLVDGVCQATPVVCGDGTTLVDGACEATLTCGTGTHLAGETCVPDATPPDGPRYEIRIAVTEIGADGYSVIPVFALGTLADGSPSTEEVVVTLSRPTAGSITPAVFDLGLAGTTTHYTPCNAATSVSCAGAATIQLARAVDPSTILATTPVITLAAPAGVGSDAPCLVGGNVLFFNGDSGSYVYSGTATITQAGWTAQLSGDTLSINLENADPGLFWSTTFSSEQLDQALQAQTYLDAQRWPFEATGHPGFDISGDGRGCNEESGKFQIEDLVVNAGTVVLATATFEQHCENAAAALRGCVHYEAAE